MPRAKSAAAPVVVRIVESGKDIDSDIQRLKKPSTKLPLRSLSNVRHNPKKERTLTVSAVRTFAQTLRVVAHSWTRGG